MCYCNSGNIISALNYIFKNRISCFSSSFLKSFTGRFCKRRNVYFFYKKLDLKLLTKLFTKELVALCLLTSYAVIDVNCRYRKRKTFLRTIT